MAKNEQKAPESDVDQDAPFERTIPNALELIANRIERGSFPRHSLPIYELCETVGLPFSTYHKEAAAGRGPVTYKIGRRVMCRIS